METADVRRKFRARIEEARRTAERRRADVERAAQDYDMFLRRVATPAFRTIASVLSAENYPFKIFTPAGALKLVSTHARDDYFEIELDEESTPPQVLGRVNRSRGGRVTTVEQPLRDGAAIADLTEEDIVEFVLAHFDAFV